LLDRRGPPLRRFRPVGALALHQTLGLSVHADPLGLRERVP
jgi:hypothetical protein